MVTAELTPKIDALSNDEYQMIGTYVDNVMEYPKRGKKDAAWQRIKSDLGKSEKRMNVEGGISPAQLRKNLGV